MLIHTMWPHVDMAMLVSGWGALSLFLCVCACSGDVFYVCTHKLLHVGLRQIGVHCIVCVCVCVCV